MKEMIKKEVGFLLKDTQALANFIKGTMPNHWDNTKTDYQNVETFRYQLKQALDTNLTEQWPSEVNEFLSGLDNVIVQQLVPQGLEFTNYWGDYISGEVPTVAAYVEYITTQLPTPRDYSKSTYYITDNSLELTPIKHFITTTIKKVFGYEFSERIVSRAFTTIPQLRAFINNYVSRIPQAIQVFLQEYADTNFPGMVKNIKAINTETTKKPLREIIVDIFVDIANLSFPTKEYAGGYAQPLSTADKAKVIKLKRDVSDLNLIIHPTLYTKIKLTVMNNLVLINKNYFNLEAFNKVIKCSSMDQNSLIIADKKFFQVKYRIRRTANQIWGANLIGQFFSHLWFLAGNVPWMVARKYQFFPSDGITDAFVQTKMETTAKLKELMGKTTQEVGGLTLKTTKASMEHRDENDKLVKVGQAKR